MSKLLNLTAAAALLASGVASAAGTMSLPTHSSMQRAPSSPTSATALKSDVDIGEQQRKFIWDGLKAVAAQEKPPGFAAHVGSTLPDALVMHAFSHDAKAELPGLDGMKYVKLESKVLVVRQSDRKIELIVHEP